MQNINSIANRITFKNYIFVIMNNFNVTDIQKLLHKLFIMLHDKNKRKSTKVNLGFIFNFYCFYLFMILLYIFE